MNNINAAIGIEQMNYINDIVKKHQDNAKFYDVNIKNKKIKKMRINNYSESACWIYTLRVKDRNGFKSYLLENGIASDTVHVRNDNYSVFKKFKLDESKTRGVNEFCAEHICIPVGWWLENKDLNHIVNVINRY